MITYNSSDLIKNFSSKAALEMLVGVLAAENPEMTIMAVRPGIVDTQILTTLMVNEGSKLGKDQADFLGSAPMLEPWQPGNAIADMVMQNGKELSGKAVEWNEDWVSKLS